MSSPGCSTLTTDTPKGKYCKKFGLGLKPSLLGYFMYSSCESLTIGFPLVSCK